MDAASQVLQTVRAGDISGVERLLESDPSLVNSHDEMGNSALLLALYYGHKEIAQMLLARGAEINIFEATAAGVLPRVKSLLDADPGLIRAYSHDGFTVLHLAAFFGHLGLVEYLLTRNPDVDAVARNPMGVTALHSAAAHYQKNIALAIVKALVGAGASVNAKQAEDFTALHAAAQSGNVELVRFLLDNGADAHSKAAGGKMPYDFAVENGHLDAAELLN
jgi:ankyrin repeat protein